MCRCILRRCIDAAGQMILMITPREMADAMTQKQILSNPPAKSAIGMAVEMLAPTSQEPAWAGSRVAAQVAQPWKPEHEGSGAYRSDRRGNRAASWKLLEQVEQFANLMPPERKAVDLHDALASCRRRSAVVGLARG